MKTTRTKPSDCPRCGATLDAAADPAGKNKPHAGDYAVCLVCAALLTYTETMTLRALTAAEMQDLDPEIKATLRRYAAAAAAVNPRRRPQ